jgi:hypothetical protein
MTHARSAAQIVNGVALMHPDGIHPNVWGQMVIAGEILIRPRARLAQRVHARQFHHRFLGSGTDE